MNVLVILNGISRKRDKFLREIFPPIKKEFQAELKETEYAGHAEKIDCSGYDIVIAAGGDGTMSQVVNNVMRMDRRPTVALVPLGSGNDLARTLKLKADDILPLLRRNRPRTLDVGKVVFNDNPASERYFINECSIGMGPEVVRRISEGSVVFGPSVTYLRSIIATFFSHQPQRIHIKTENYEWEGDARVLAVANGKAFGHSIFIAPDAEMDDGKMNMFLCKGLPLLKFLMYLQAIKQPKKIDDKKWIDYRFVEELKLTAPKPLPVEADGELIGFTPLVCGVVRKTLKVLA